MSSAGRNLADLKSGRSLWCFASPRARRKAKFRRTLAAAAFGAAMAPAMFCIAEDASGTATEAPFPATEMHFAECPTALSGEILRVLAIELGAPIVEVSLPRARLRVVCVTPTDIELELRSTTLDRAEVRRRMSLDDHDRRIHGRIVALALTELIEAARLRADDEQARPRKPPAPPAPEAKRSAAVPGSLRAPRVSLAASAVGMVWPHDGTWSAGAELLSTVPIGGPWALMGGVGFTGGHGEFALGRIVVRSLAVPLALHWKSPGRLPWGAATGMRGGWVRLTGEAADLSTTTDGSIAGFWAGPFASLDTAFPSNTEWGAAARVELGYAVWSVRGIVEGEPSPWMGPWLLFALGVEWRP